MNNDNNKASEIDLLKINLDKQKETPSDFNKYHVEFMNNFEDEYRRVHEEKADIERKSQETEDIIIKINNEINAKGKELREANYQEGASISKMKKEIYNDEKNKDDSKLFNVITVLQILVLVALLLGLFNVVNTLFITIIIIVIYIVIVLAVVIKVKNDNGRDKFDYNQYNIELEGGGVCDVKNI